MKCASCKARIQGKPHELIPSFINGAIDTRRSHAICSPACMAMCERGTLWVQAGPFVRITEQLTPERVHAACEEYGRQAYADWEAQRGIATSERVN